MATIEELKLFTEQHTRSLRGYDITSGAYPIPSNFNRFN